MGLSLSSFSTFSTSIIPLSRFWSSSIPSSSAESVDSVPPDDTSAASSIELVDSVPSDDTPVTSSAESVDSVPPDDTSAASSIESVDSVPSDDASVTCYKYDVFLSFRGEDTRKGIIHHLNHELQRAERRIETFIDSEKLQIGMPISHLLKAIEESRLVIVIFSTNYASSTWCLDELVNIFRCKEGKHRILPIFYNVEPSDVRYQRGSFGVALSKHEQNPNQDRTKVKQWRTALGKVGNLSGWDMKNFGSDKELVERIVADVGKKLAAESRQSVASQNLYAVWRAHFSVGPYGSNNGGTSFDDCIHSMVRQVVIGYTDSAWINYIKIEYDVGGDSMWSDTHGDPNMGTKDMIVTLTLDYPHEYLTSIQGCYEKPIPFFPTQITSITFITNRGKTFGPFGDTSVENNFTIHVPNTMIVGFHGRAGDFTGLRAIGVHLKALYC